jgi:hypothetical protein
MGLRPDSFDRSDLIAWCAEHHEEVSTKKAGRARGSGVEEAARYFLAQFNLETVRAVFAGQWKRPKKSTERYSLAMHIDGLLGRIESGELTATQELRIGEELIGWIAEFANTHPAVMKDRRKYFAEEEAGAAAMEHQDRFAEQLRGIG